MISSITRYQPFIRGSELYAFNSPSRIAVFAVIAVLDQHHYDSARCSEGSPLHASPRRSTASMEKLHIKECFVDIKPLAPRASTSENPLSLHDIQHRTEPRLAATRYSDFRLRTPQALGIPAGYILYQHIDIPFNYCIGRCPPATTLKRI